MRSLMRRVTGATFTAVLLVAALSSLGCIGSGSSAGKVDLGEQATLAIGNQVQIAGRNLRITFQDVSGDSRCPRDAVCVQAGQVSVEIEIIDAEGAHAMTLTYPGLTDAAAVASYGQYQLSFKVTPQPVVDHPVGRGEYRLLLTVSLRDGTLEGLVKIGPLQPVERSGDPTQVPPQVYDARKVMVYDASGQSLIRQVDIGHDGHYQVELKPGTYVVDIKHIGIDSSKDVPRTIDLSAGQTITLDIDIDTGIR